MEQLRYQMNKLASLYEDDTRQVKKGLQGELLEEYRKYLKEEKELLGDIRNELPKITL